MKIIIEGYHYDREVLKANRIEGGMLDRYVSFKDHVRYDFVGHVYSEQLKDYVFFLPKVILREDYKKKDDGSFEIDPETKERVVAKETVFGLLPSEIISIDKTNANYGLTNHQKYFICELSIWIYKALSVFYNSPRGRKSSVIEANSSLSDIKNGKIELYASWLDSVIKLCDFYRANKDYVVFQMRNRKSGLDNINWIKTINRTHPFFQDNVPIYIDPITRKKEVDTDNELYIIYYSVLNYIERYFGLPVFLNVSFELIKGKRFEAYLNGLGCARLRRIKYKCFSDRDLKIWNLCFAFFDRAHNTNGKTFNEDYLVASSFELVFEAIIDELVGSDVPKELVKQKDGKRVDHMFTYKDLITSSVRQSDIVRKTYYIGDSKYYKIGTTVADYSEYKQYTYAKNVIQWNLDLYNFNTLEKQHKKNSDNIWIRDELTKGYDVIPNFFISAKVNESYSFSDDKLSGHEEIFFSCHELNQLFDRDTFLLTHYDVNFLYVISLYAKANKLKMAAWQHKVRDVFRTSFLETLNREYSFYLLKPKKGVSQTDFQKSYYELRGKIYSYNYSDDESKRLFFLALLKKESKILAGKYKNRELDEVRVKIEKEKSETIDIIKNYFEYESIVISNVLS